MTAPGGGFQIASAYVDITARDNTDAGRRGVERNLGSIRDRTVNINTRADDTGARRIAARLAALRDRTLRINVDGNAAAGGLRRIQNDANQAEGALGRLRNINLPNIAGPLLMGLAAVPAAAAAAAAAIAAIPAAGASLGLVGGVLAGSFSGVGDALKGFTADQDRAAAGGGGNGAANAARSSARAIRDATQQINDARRDQARTARDSAQQIEDAERAVQDAARSTARAQRGVADAVREAARTARDGAQQVKDAEESVQEAQEAAAKSARDNARAVVSAKQAVADAERAAARAAESAADQVASAERRLSDAQRASTQAQKDLNRAREQAVQDLADLQERASDAARDEKGAVLDLAEARLRLDRVNNDALSTDLDKAKAAYDVEVAEDRLKDANKAATDAAGASNLAQAKGVEGADAVVDAKQRVADATQSATDAQHSLKDALQSAADSAQDSAERIANAQQSLVDAQERAAEAQIDANHRIQDAVENLSQARTRAAEANADAQERIVQAQEGVQDSIRAQEDAERQLARTKQQAADSAVDAAERVANAEQGLKDAQQDANAATIAGAAAASKFAEAMAKLSPLQRELVRELLRWKDIMHDLGRTASDAFLPGFIQMLKDAEGLQGIFNSALQRTGTIMGDTARKMGELFKSEDFKKNLDALLKAADPITKSIGNLFVDMTDTLVRFGANMGPAAEGFAHFIDGVNLGLQGFFDALSTPESAEAFGSILESLGSIMQTFLPIIGRLAAELAQRLAPVLRDFADWAATHQDQIVGFFENVGTGVGMLLDAIEWLADRIGEWVGIIRDNFNTLGGLPGSIQETAGNLMDGLVQGLEAGIDGVINFFTVTLPDAVLGTFRSIFGINSPSTVFAEFGRNFLEGLLQGLGELTTKVQEWFTKFKDDAIARMTEWKDGAIQRVVDFKNGVERWIAGIPGWVRDRFQEFKDWAHQKLEEWKTGGLQKVLDFKTGVQNHITGIPGWVRDRFNEFRDWAIQKLNEWKTTGLQRVSEFKTGIENFIRGIPGWVRDRFNELKDWALAKLTEWKNTGTQRAREIVDGIMGWISGLPAKVQTAFRDVKDWALRELNALRDLAGQPIRFVVDTVYDHGIKPMWNSIATVFNLPRLATGGIMPGYTPGRDVHLAALSGGEAVMRPEWTRAAGADYINGANAAARTGGVSGAQAFIQQNGVPGYALGGIVTDLFTGGADAVRRMFGGALGDNNRTPGQASNWRTGAMQPAPRAVDGAVALVKKTLDSMLTAVGVGGGGGAQRWAPVVLQALSMMGQPASLLNVVLRRMNQESGGNPRAINLWDSNALRGDPSRGLMQTIGSTFRAYHFPGTSNDIYDPLANILASMRYAMARYGSLSAAYNKAGGYDEGGVASGIGMLPKRTPKPERVLSPDQTAAFERLVDDLGSPRGRGGVTVQNLHINVTGVLDFRQRDVATRQIVADLMAQIDAIERSHA